MWLTDDQIADILLDGQPYLLARSEQIEGARAWVEDQVPRTTARRTEQDARYGIADAQLEIPFAWETWHAGYGDLYVRSSDRYFRSGGHDTRWPNKIQASPEILTTTLSIGAVPSGNDAQFFQFDNRFYLLIGRYVAQIFPTATIHSTMNNLSEHHTSAVVYQNQVIIGRTDISSNGYERQIAFLEFNGTNAPDANAANLPGSYLTLARNKVWRSWIDRSPTMGVRYVVANADGSLGATGQWSGMFEVGDGSARITNMVSYNGGPIVGKEDGVYAWVSADSQFKNILPTLQRARHADNCKAMAVWQGHLMVGHTRGLTMLREVQENVWEAREVGPERVAQNNTPQGYFLSLVPDGAWLWGALYSPGSNSVFLLTGRLQAPGEGIPEQGGMVWHQLTPEYAIGVDTRNCRAVGISTVTTNPFLCMAHPNTASTLGVRYFVLPRGGGDPNGDTACRFTGSLPTSQDAFHTSRHDNAAPATPKVMTEIVVEHEDVTGTSSISLLYNDGVGDVTVGTINSGDPNPMTFTLNAPRIGYAHRVLVMMRGDGNVTPKVRKIVGKAILRPDFLHTRAGRVRLGTGLRLKNGAIDNRTAADQLSHLRGLTGSANATLVTPAGVQETVAVIGPVRVVESAQYGKSDRELIAELTMRRIP